MKDNRTEIKITSFKQALFYADNGMQPLRIERGFDNKMVFVYDKQENHELFLKWREEVKKWKKKQGIITY